MKQIDREVYFLFVVLFNFIDLFETYYIILHFGGGELNILYKIGGWGLLVFVKIMMLFLIYYLSFIDVRIIKLYFYFYIFVVFRNLYVLLLTLGQ